MKQPRLTMRALALEIKRRWPGLTVAVTRDTASTDRKIGRLRRQGKGRTGSRLIVSQRGACPCVASSRPMDCIRCGGSGRAWVVIFDHNNAETYRRLAEVRAWIDGRK